MTAEESLGGHGFGIFGGELVNDEIVAVNTFLVESGGWSVGDMSGGDGAGDAYQGDF